MDRRAQARIADTAWRIQERGAPSPRAYQRLMAAWMRRVQAAILRAMTGDLSADAAAEEEDDAARQRRLARIVAALRALRMPPPPTPPQIAAVNAPAARQGIRTSRRQLLQLGLPREVMEARFQIPTGAEDLLVGIDIAPTAQDRAILTRWSREGTDLIHTVGQDLVAGLDEQVAEFARSGRPLSELSKVVQERLGIADRHADFIARDQVAKLNSALTESTQRAAGVTRYRWRSSTDQRVRPMHHALDGSIHSWGDPPVTNKDGDRNNPGEDYQCRCVAIPILDEEAQPRAPKPLRPGLAPADERETPGAPRPAPQPPLHPPAPPPPAPPPAPPPPPPPPVEVEPPTPRPVPPPTPPRSEPAPKKRRAPPTGPRAIAVAPGLAHLSPKDLSIVQDLGTSPQTLEAVKKVGGFAKQSEALAALERLEEEGLVTQSGDRYTVTSKYRALAAARAEGQTDEDIINALGLGF